ncbi:MAG: isoprenylcysteine carboxylmethyltransferase family protein [Candidatus Bathyarchaeota archaeon]|nr:MAG: isoprenylcysteine carboxylmethyltransferase family protein [Candidatus Bathyarchaeota archaeon]
METRSAGIRQAAVSCLLLAMMMAVFFALAGRIDIPRAWVFFAATFLYLSASTAAIYRYNPELLAMRLTIRREGSKAWDEILMRAINLTAMLVVPAVAGLDVGRYRWSQLGVLHAGLGLLLFVVSSVLIVWAMVENPFFEATVRIQADRGHYVVSTGPYGFVRHPGYLSGILWTSSIPLIIGSLYAYIPVALYSAMMILRTHLEDKTLHVELAGYADYAKRVRYRLLPGVW